MLNVLCVYVVFLSQRYLCSVMLIVLYIVYRVLSLSVNPMLRTYINLSKQHSFMLTKETAKGHVGLTSTICRNFEFYQNGTKIWRNLAYEMLCSASGGFAPRPPDQRLCRWTPLGAQPQSPVATALAIAPQNAKTKLRQMLLNKLIASLIWTDFHAVSDIG